MYDKYHMTIPKATKVLSLRDKILSTIHFGEEIYVVLYEEPEGTPRPRARFINKTNLAQSAKKYPGFIQVYSITGKSDRDFMHKLISENDFARLNGMLIYTPCCVDYSVYLKTPFSFNSIDTYLAELGCIRPICKPDFDNMEKKYADMYNGNIWADDSLVIEASIHKYYSILPRVEIRLSFLNMLYNKAQYKSMAKKLQRDDIEYFDQNK